MNNQTSSDYIAELRAKLEAAERERDELQQWVHDCQSGMYINCVYCGHRYGPDDGNHLATMQDALRAHIEVCPKHPMSALRKEKELIEITLTEQNRQVAKYNETIDQLRTKAAELEKQLAALMAVARAADADIQKEPQRKIGGYLWEQFRATQGHLPLRDYVANLEVALTAARKVCPEI